MAYIISYLDKIEAVLKEMVRNSGKTVPKGPFGMDTVAHLDYIIDLLGTMVSKQTYDKVMKDQYDNVGMGIEDRTRAIYELLNSGEISGDIDLEPITITENGETVAGASKGFSKVIVEVPDSGAGEKELFEGTAVTYSNELVSYISRPILQGVSTLTNVEFPNCSEIGSYAFSGCTNLSYVSFPECVVVRNNAFDGCTSLPEINFSICQSIGSSAFRNCTSMSTVVMENCENVQNSAFASCAALAIASFPYLETIGEAAFSDCTSLSQINLPKISSIGTSAFNKCYALVDFYMPGSSVCTLVNGNAFANTPMSSYYTSLARYGSFYVPSTLLSTYQAAAGWSAYSARFVGLTEDQIAEVMGE